MEKRYDHQKTEKRIYSFWEKGGWFTPKIVKGKKPFTVTLPPPNVTGSLHAGHAMMVIEDVMARFWRMQGRPTLFLPGFDHASIAVEYLVSKQIRKEGKTKSEAGRAEFLRRAKKFADDSRDYIRNQLKLVGFSCDWSREAYTLDKVRTEAVKEAFVRLFEKELIYQGERIINWCPKCQTAISDLENEHQEVKAQLWYLQYPLEGGEQFVRVATTRPETMLGDTGVAVNPADKRFKKLVGKRIILPLMNRRIPIVADEAVEPKFGTGAVKVTPGHDENDFEIGQRHGLEVIKIIDEKGQLTEAAGKFKGMKVLEARKAVLEELKKEGWLVKTEEITHAVGHCQRCGTITEPLVSKQWFVKTKPLAQKAIEAVESGKIKILPSRFEKTYFHWLNNIQDWCISRQLWWGHQIPIYYCQEVKNEECRKKEGVFTSKEKPKKCPYCGSKEIEQDEDILDTWFSSALWPISTLGWPEKTEDFGYFYPTTLRETGYDILFFWVTKEIMMCLEATGQIPFETVYFHGLVRDKKGQKFSKSKGIGFDPVEVIKDYGADALRMALVVGTTPGNDVRIDKDKIRAYRNYANKVWNIGRFVLSNLPKKYEDLPSYSPTLKGLTKKDKEIIKKFEELVKQVTEDFKNYRLSPAGEAVYHFLWHELADKYVEDSKERIKKGDKAVLSVLRYVYLHCLILLHPLMPFVTEEIWAKLPRLYDEPLIISKWPN